MLLYISSCVLNWCNFFSFDSKILFEVFETFLKVRAIKRTSIHSHTIRRRQNKERYLQKMPEIYPERPFDMRISIYWLLNFQKRNINYFHLRARGILQSRDRWWETTNLPSTKENWSKKQWQLQRCVLVDSENNKEFTCLELIIFNHVVKISFTLSLELSLITFVPVLWGSLFSGQSMARAITNLAKNSDDTEGH